MIIRETIDKYDGSFRITLYEKGEDGSLGPAMTRSLNEDLIDVYFEQRAEESARLLEQLQSHQISSIGYYAALHALEPAALAPRVRLSKRKVIRHMTWEGFKGASVEVLQRYAKVFNVAVGDFFTVLLLPDDVDADADVSADRALQQLRIRPSATGE